MDKNEDVNLITELANTRRYLTAARGLKKDAFEKWQADNKQILDMIAAQEKYEAELLTAIRSKYETEAVIIKNEKGEEVPQDRQPHPAIKLQMKDATEINYDKNAAFSYCLRNLTTCLNLDAKGFEAQAKTGKLPAEVVTVKPGKKVAATIATDLDEFATALM